MYWCQCTTCWNIVKIIQKYFEVFFQCYSDEPALDDDGDVVNFGNNNTIDSFKFKV